MFLGVSRQRWIAAGVLIALGLAFFVTGFEGMLGGIIGVGLILVGFVTFGTTPRHHAPPRAAAKPTRPVPTPPAQRPDIEARDASDV
jgi:hypothetical protein